MRPQPTAPTSNEPPCAAPAVTVVIASYNGAHLLPRALDSVLSQTFQDFEIIISDDGSTDNTKDVVQPYLADARIRYHYDENGGLAVARNRGIRRARGEFVLMLDCDDTLPPNSLERHVSIAQTEQAGWVRIALNRIEGDATRIVHSPIPSDTALEYALEHGIWGCAFLYRRAALEQVGLYDEGLRIFEDTDLDMRLLMAGVPFASTSEPLYNYHIQPHSLVKGSGAARRRLAGSERHFRKYQKPAARKNPRVRRAYADNMAWIAAGYWRERMGLRRVLRAGFEVLWADPGRPLRLVARRLFGMGRRPSPEP